MMVIAPLDANTLAKIANGICDNLLVSTLMTVKVLFQDSHFVITAYAEAEFMDCKRCQQMFVKVFAT